MISQSELLQWGITNQQTSESLQKLDEDAKESVSKFEPQKLDSKWVDIILGRSDAIRIKELILEIQLPSTDTALLALEELEGFVQSIDNANDLRPLNAWPVLFESLKLNVLVKDVLWVIGTALQNNEKAQAYFMTLDGMKLLMDLELVDTKTLLKLFRCYSALLQHSEENVKLFYDAGGFKKLLDSIDEITLRSRIVFILKALVQEFSIVALMLVKSGWIDELYRYKNDEEVVEFMLLVYTINPNAVNIQLLGDK